MTSAESNRLAVVETKVEALNVTVTKFDGKLDSVLAYIELQKARDEVKREEEARAEKELRFRMWAIPTAVTVINALIAWGSFASGIVRFK